jgi:TRAP-type C4-dicarboxylate transport system permease small subunit
MPKPARWFMKAAEITCVLGFAALFCVFMLQVFYRYVLNHPLAWSQEIAAILYVWIVCLGAATIVSEREHVTFSLIYASVRPRVRRVLAILGTGFVTLVFIAAFYGNLDYIAFTTRQKTPTLRLPMSLVFGAFGVFMTLVILLGLLRLWRLSRPGWRQED